MKSITIPAMLVGICLTLCSCNANVRNDLEELSKYSWIAPRPATLVFEAKDENYTNNSEAIVETSDLMQEAVNVFSDLHVSATETDALVSPDTESAVSDVENSVGIIESVSGIETDTNTDTSFSVSAPVTDTVEVVSDTNPPPEADAKTADIISETVAELEEQSIYVWIPKSGKKYHSKATCSNMSAPSKVTVAEAEALGFTKCKRCY